MVKRKLIVELDINDDRINSIEDLEQEILAQDNYGQVARKYLDSLQDDMVQYMNARKGRKCFFVPVDEIKENDYDLSILGLFLS